MTGERIKEYYVETANRETRVDLVFAASLIKSNKIAVDCGCGEGSNIAYLRTKEFIVHTFDIEDM